MTAAPTIVWFERDLRLEDNRALIEAAAMRRPVLPVYILDEEDSGRWRLGGASRWWLHHSLTALAADLRSIGLPLILRRGRAADIIPALAAEAAAGLVTWNRRYEPWCHARDRRIKIALHHEGISARSYNAALLHEPWRVKTGSGQPYRLFTPFWRALRALEGSGAPLPKWPPHLRAPRRLPISDRLFKWRLLPTRPDWSGGLRSNWLPGERGARIRLLDFLDNGLADYRDQRDRPDREGTSMLSPHLHHGEISPRTVWAAVETATAADPSLAPDGEAYLRRLARREFSHHLLFNHDHLPDRPLRAEFADFPWREAPHQLRAWQQGRTGYPIVDAGMRQLWRTGWMHNRVRMIAASFLVKDLMVPWQEGAAWFWDTLVDANLASNAANWQWMAGCGADAAPFFRVSNPVLQGEKFDPDGTYVREFVPELAHLPTAHIHKPWAAPAAVLAVAGVRLGIDYPTPIVDHPLARRRALDALADMKQVAARVDSA